MSVDPNPEFQSLSEAAVVSAVNGPDPAHPIAVEVGRLVAGYTVDFHRHLELFGHMPADVLSIKTYSPIEVVAMRLTQNAMLKPKEQGRITAAHCTNRLQTTVDDLAARGVDSTIIVAALAEAAINVARKEPELGVAALDSAAEVISAHAESLRQNKVSQ